MHDPADWPDAFDDRERAALQLADAMSGHANARFGTELVERLRLLFDEVELAELLLVAGQANLNNRAGNAAKQLLGDR